MVRTNQPPRGGPYHSLPQCGCWVPVQTNRGAQKQFLSLVDGKSHTTILSTSTRTTLHQTFSNATPERLNEVQYTFPLFDGVSVVAFQCTVESTTLVGVVKEKQQARTDYKEAVARGETAGLLEQLSDASDVFTTKIGNVAANGKILVEITYLGELHHDSEADATRFTIPTAIAPRYGTPSFTSQQTLSGPTATAKTGINISVNIILEEASIIRQVQSPSHPLAITIGRTLDTSEEDYKTHCAFATLALNSTELGKDFVLVISSKEQGTPQGLLESHPNLPQQRAIMATLVPKFNLPNIVPEIVFVVDRSGSMGGKIETLVSSLRVFLKSLPVNGVKFNICSFGTHFSFLFQKSKTYDQSSLDEAMQHLKTFDSNFGGTEMLQPIRQTCQQRFADMPLQVMVLTDGQIWDQEGLFNFINTQKNARFFSLGIGAGASTALVEGIARAGGGFAQFVAENEKMDRKVVRMLKGALMPHIEYSVEVQYEADDDFEMIESSAEKSNIAIEKHVDDKKPISLYDVNAKEEPTNPPAGRYDSLPNVPHPKAIQAPHQIPALFPFCRSTLYLLLNPGTSSKPTSVKLSGRSSVGPVELVIPIQDVGTDSTIHQLAAKKAIQELEEGRGWLATTKGHDNQLLKASNEGRWDLIVERECVRLGTTFGVAGKFTSFVAITERKDSSEDQDEEQLGSVHENVVPEPATSSLRGGGRAFCKMAAPPPPPGGLFGASTMPTARSRDIQYNRDVFTFGSPAPSSGNILATMKQNVSSIFTSAAPRRQLASRAAARPTAQAEDEGYGAEFRATPAMSSALPDDDDDEGDDMGFSFRRDEGEAGQQVFSAKKPTHLSDGQRMHQIIGLQTFEGSWADTDKLWNLIGITKQDLAQQVPRLSGEAMALATIGAIKWLQMKMQDESEVWEMVVDKAKVWLRGLGKVDNVEVVLDAAIQCFGVA